MRTTFGVSELLISILYDEVPSVVRWHVLLVFEEVRPWTFIQLNSLRLVCFQRTSYRGQESVDHGDFSLNIKPEPPFPTSDIVVRSG